MQVGLILIQGAIGALEQFRRAAGRVLLPAGGKFQRDLFSGDLSGRANHTFEHSPRIRRTRHPAEFAADFFFSNERFPLKRWEERWPESRLGARFCALQVRAQSESKESGWTDPASISEEASSGLALPVRAGTIPKTSRGLELLLARHRGPCENSGVRSSIPALLGAAGLCAGGSLFSWAAVAPSAQLFGPTVRRTGDCLAVALTFDDGPNPAVTPAILDLLDRHGASATFFQIGDHVGQFPALAREVSSRGHSLGNHTATHPRLVFLSPRRIGEELERCAVALLAATGRRPRWMRPPYGYRGPQLQAAVRRQDADLRVVMWSVSCRDWRVQPSERIIKRLRRVRGGDIVLLHDGDHRTPQGDRSHTVAALEYWLPRWRDAGIRLVGMDDLARTMR